jgi:hypothetical protein
MFLLMNHLKIDYVSLRGMPVSYRAWFRNRLFQQWKQSAPKDQYGLDDDTPISKIG